MAKFYRDKYYVTSDNAKINYIDEGLSYSNTIFFLHDFTRRGMSFNRIAQELVHFNRVIWFDYRGHGKTKSKGPYTIDQLSKDINELITYLNISDITFIGYGLGAFVLFQYIKDYGTSKIKSSTFIDISPKLLNDHDWSYGIYQGNYYKSELTSDLELIKTQPRKFLSYYYSQTMPEHSKDESREYEPTLLFKILSLITLNKKALNYWEEMILSDYRNDLSKINFPVNIIYANPGSLFSEHGSLFLKSNIPNSKAYSVCSSTHSNILMKTSEILEIIQNNN